jgi:hypothetical protein
VRFPSGVATPANSRFCLVSESPGVQISHQNGASSTLVQSVTGAWFGVPPVRWTGGDWPAHATASRRS